MYRLEKMTLREVLEKSGRFYGKKPVSAVFGGPSVTFRDFSARAAAFSGKLRDGYGVGRETRVAILGENRPEWGIAYFAVTAMGAVAVPILTEFAPEQIGNILTHAECAGVIVSTRFRAKLSVTPPGFFIIAMEEILAGLMEPDSTGTNRVGMDADIDVDEDDLAAIIYTSGTTGLSKGVMLTHGNIVSNAYATRAILRMRPGDRLVSILPLAHTYECTLGLVAVVLQGACVTYLEKPPTATVLLPVLKEVRPTVMISVPLIMEKIYRSSFLPVLRAHALYRLGWGRRLLHVVAGMKLKRLFGGRIRFFGIGGAALAPDVEAFLAEAGFPYAIGYGLTETSPLVAGCGPRHTRLGSAGLVLSGVEIRIAYTEESRDGAGEVQVRGPNVMRGYFKEPGLTADAFTPDGWFRTGDLGFRDARGRLFIRGRSKSVILGPSGENIYPEEIEALLNASSCVQESLVCGGIEDGIVALVTLKPEIVERISESVREAAAALEDQAQDLLQAVEERTAEMLETLRKETNARLAGFSRIARIRLARAPFEKTPTQKIKRYLYTAGHAEGSAAP